MNFANRSFSPPSSVTREELYSMVSTCYGMTGLLVSYVVACGNSSEAEGHVLAGLDMLRRATGDLLEALDPLVPIVGHSVAEVNHARN